MNKLQENDLEASGLHIEEEKHEWALDVVCGMDVDPTTTHFHTMYKEEPYYFCNRNCMTHFEDNPERYVG